MTTLTFKQFEEVLWSITFVIHHLISSSVHGDMIISIDNNVNIKLGEDLMDKLYDQTSGDRRFVSLDVTINNYLEDYYVRSKNGIS